MNGRVPIPDMPCSIVSPITSSASAHDVISAELQNTPVSDIFFSSRNINALHEGICNMVFNMSNGKYNIGRQSDQELKIIMRSFYLNSLRGGVPRFQDNIYPIDDPLEQTTLAKVRKLNKEVLDWSVPRIITNIQQYERYKQDVSKLPVPNELPAFVSSAGSKSNEFPSFF